MDAEKRIENVQAALQRRFRIAGRGSVNRVQEQLNLGAGYFKNQRRSGRRRVDLKILFRALDALEVDSAEFFTSVLGPADPVDSFKTEAGAMRRQARQPPPILTLAASRGAEEDFEEVDLAALDALRNEDPRRVLRRIRDLVTRVPEHQLPKLLGIHASASRALGKMEEAQMVLAHALDLAEERDDPALLADLLQRSSYVMNYRGQAEKALELSERATLHYVALGDLAGIGKTLVDQGVWYGYLEDNEGELSSFRSALSYLPAESDRADVRKNRFSCLMNLGITYRKLGDLERHRIANVALTALLRCALAGRGLSAAFLDRVARGLEQGRRQQAAAPPKRG